ncbi:type VI secretion system protein TssA [Desulfatitalea alkaliphila]|uniref:Type VI secretion system protein TssA n=1 Tax=Desulfatitalea alkaliphila TaxID=2929485 RepID=A0AA41UK08_9BACT|nr:type VI secretion system protein TssA [Desulfatitalea alkaliphila]MCJ8501794.1 type VI secretion system protein TssA [Desulfatitalea alkaliphila]
MDLSAIGTTPISEATPGGADVRYDPDFEALQAEIDKLGSPTASGQVDWSRVIDLATAILQSKAKDLNAAVYLCVALVTTRQCEGLDQGLALLKALLENFWDTLHPPKKRMRGRAGAIDWWLEKTENALSRLPAPAPLPAEMPARMLENLHAIDSLLADKMPDAPILRQLQRRIETFPISDVQEAATPPPAAAETPAIPAQSQDPPATAAATPPIPAPRATAPTKTEEGASENLSSSAEARKAADGVMQRLRRISLALLEHDTADPLAYRYRRIAGWARVMAAPPVNKDGNTAIAPPAPQVLQQLEELRSAGNAAALLPQLEQKVSQHIFWLDLHRYTAETLQDLGNAHQAAHDAVCHETAALLRRLPTLAALCFSDGMPFADDPTRQWLAQIGCDAQPAGQGGTAGPATADDPLAETVDAARSMARKKQLVEAVGLLQQKMQQSPGRRNALRWRLAIIRLLLEHRKAPAAVPHVEYTLTEMQRFDLARWEPALAVEVLSLAGQAFDAQSGNEHKSRAGEMRHRVAALDPVAALRADRS